MFSGNILPHNNISFFFRFLKLRLAKNIVYSFELMHQRSFITVKVKMNLEYLKRNFVCLSNDI